MPTIVQTAHGKVTGLWGSAVLRTSTGKLVPLKLGDLVNQGDVILTTQDGIVQLTNDRAETRTADATPDLDRVIAELNQSDPQTAPAAGLTGGDGSGLTPGLRVDRISEGIGSASFGQASDAVLLQPLPPATVPPEQLAAVANTLPVATPATVNGAEDASLTISLTGTDTDGNVT